MPDISALYQYYCNIGYNAIWLFPSHGIHGVLSKAFQWIMAYLTRLVRPEQTEELGQHHGWWYRDSFQHQISSNHSIDWRTGHLSPPNPPRHLTVEKWYVAQCLFQVSLYIKTYNKLLVSYTMNNVIFGWLLHPVCGRKVTRCIIYSVSKVKQ